MARGLIGSMIAGGVSSVAKTRLRDMEEREDFNYRQAMQEALLDKQQAIELATARSKADMKVEYEQQDRDRVKGLVDKYRGPEDTRGGYETEEMVAARKAEESKRIADGLRGEAEFGAADNYDRSRNAEERLAAVEARNKILEDGLRLRDVMNQRNNETKKETVAATNESRERVSEGKNKTALSVAEKRAATVLRGKEITSGKAGRLSQKEQAYKAYFDRESAKGGDVLDFDLWLIEYDTFKGSKTSTTTEKFTEGSKVTERRSTIGKPAAGPWDRFK